jgi:choline dehydrogenase
MRRRARPNLRVLGDTTVDRIAFDHRGGAVGVRTSDGALVHAGQTVLCAGAIGSAAILLCSGIGPADQLRGLGTDVVADLPVGRRLREHPCAYLLFSAPAELLGATDPPASVLLWTRSSLAAPGELDLHIAPSHLVRPSSYPHGSGLGFLLSVTRTEETAHGTLRLRDSDPTTPPHVSPGLLAHPRDRRKLAEALSLGRELAAAAPLRALGLREIAPGPHARSGTEVDAYLRANVKPYPHVVRHRTDGARRGRVLGRRPPRTGARHARPPGGRRVDPARRALRGNQPHCHHGRRADRRPLRRR